MISSDEKKKQFREFLSFVEAIGNMASEYGINFQRHDSSQGYFIAGQLTILMRAAESAGRTAKMAIEYENRTEKKTGEKQ